MSIPKMNKHEWESKLKEIKVNKSDLNKLIMNYLMMQGYQEAIEAFEQESSSITTTTTATATATATATNTDTINTTTDTINNNNNNHSINHNNNISTRVTIRNELMNGNISKAIQLINNFNPKLLQSSPKLYFHLKNQQFIEFIKNNQLDEALQFAQLEIAPIITIENEIDFLNEMEKSMSLLAFSEMENSPFGILLTSVQRKKIASEVNFEILKILDSSSSKKGNTDNENKEENNDDTSVVDLNIVTKLHYLLKVLQYLQLKLQEKKSFPKIENFVTCELVQSKMVLNNNSHLNSGGISGISGISGGLHNEEEEMEEEEEEEEL
ncbi:hypothetical protein ABK040_006193 [Willaertia magna]